MIDASFINILLCLPGFLFIIWIFSCYIVDRNRTVNYLLKDNEVGTLNDRDTGYEIHKLKIGKIYMWWIVLAVAYISFVIRHWA